MAGNVKYVLIDYISDNAYSPICKLPFHVKFVICNNLWQKKYLCEKQFSTMVVGKIVNLESMVFDSWSFFLNIAELLLNSANSVNLKITEA